MIDEFPKAHLHDHLRWVRESLVWKLDGLSEYDVRRPLTMTGTNLLGLVKHNAISDSRYFGEVFARPFAEPLPRWDDQNTRGTDHWATEGETREDIVGLYRRVWDHVDATIDALKVDSPGFVPWWNEDVQLFNVRSTGCPTPLVTPDMRTSCASSWTAQWEPSPRISHCTALIRSSGAPEERSWSRSP